MPPAGPDDVGDPNGVGHGPPGVFGDGDGEGVGEGVGLDFDGFGYIARSQPPNSSNTSTISVKPVRSAILKWDTTTPSVCDATADLGVRLRLGQPDG